MNSITIATKTTRMGNRLQTAASQASERGSHPQAVVVGMVTGPGGGGQEDTALSSQTPIHLRFPGPLGALTLPGAGEAWKGCGALSSEQAWPPVPSPLFPPWLAGRMRQPRPLPAERHHLEQMADFLCAFSWRRQSLFHRRAVRTGNRDACKVSAQCLSGNAGARGHCVTGGVINSC